MTAEIQITRTKDEPGATTLTVEAPVEVVRKAERKAASYYAKRARIPGFRKGKVPTDVIRRRFGDAIKETVIKELVSDSWKIALDREKLEPLAEPQVHELKFEDDQPVTFEFLVEVKPDLEIERIGGFSVTRKVAPVTSEMVEAQIEELRQQNAPLVPIEDEKPKPGDYVQVTLAMLESTEDVDVESKPYQIQLGGGQAIPAVEEQIMGLLPGETVEAPVKFPDDFSDEAKRGQTVTARISLHEVKRLDVPDLDDDFAKEVGDFETADDLRSAVRTDLEKAADREGDGGVRRELVEQIVAANNVPAPRPMVERLLRAYAEAYQVPQDQNEKFRSEFGPIVESQVKRDLTLDNIANAHDLRATEEDIDQRVEKIAESQKSEPGKVYAALQKDNRIKELERSITDEKVYEFLLGQSTIIES